MVPTPLSYLPSRLPRLLLTLTSVASQHVPNARSFLSNSLSVLAGTASGTDADSTSLHVLAKREHIKHDTKFYIFACLIPVLVLSSGLFAGLTLGYMSLDETQLNVLSISGTPEQKKYANKIKPIRKDGHLLLVTLLLANMIVNETLPVISDPVLGGGAQSVVVSTVLIVIFAEIIPQSLCTRYGLYFGAKMAGVVRVLMWTLGIISWPVARLLEFVLGPHHGIIYRRAELKELIALHSNNGELGGDLNTDTVTIIGGALDLQEKVVKQAMTPIENVFMLSIDAKLDYETLRKICITGHSRIPVYEEVDVPIPTLAAVGALESRELLALSTPTNFLFDNKPATKKVKRIIGILLVKQCVLLDPKDATPIRKIPLNRVPFVPNNEPLLGILDTFQEGRSHMAIVSRFSVAKAASVKQAVKRGLTQRLRDRVLGDTDSSSSGSESEEEGPNGSPQKSTRNRKSEESDSDKEASVRTGSIHEDRDDRSRRPKKHARFGIKSRGRNKKRVVDEEMAMPSEDVDQHQEKQKSEGLKSSLILPKSSFRNYEQNMPADAVLATEGADEFLEGVDAAVMPLGIITLEDVLEELIGEEIYDEFDPQGHPDLTSYSQPEPKGPTFLKHKGSAPNLMPDESTAAAGPYSTNPPVIEVSKSITSTPLLRPIPMPALKTLKGLAFARSRSAPPIPREEKPPVQAVTATVRPSMEIPEDGTSTLHGTFNEKDMTDEVLVFDSATRTTSYPELISPVRSTPYNPQPMQIRAPIPVSATASSPGPTSLAALSAISRSSSPAPSLEHVIMVERKRRATAGASSMPPPKGNWFKSSPLTGDRSGVVVAERIKKIPGLGDQEEVRISSDNNKSSPDKHDG